MITISYSITKGEVTLGKVVIFILMKISDKEFSF